ncbi:MAG: hypothetical protein JWN43_1597, partial [Gammaproteobacteria bacterium]|nr:hypothetical protein [Gammaproteobacteria bacterium]
PSNSMRKSTVIRVAGAALCALGLASAASGQATSRALVVKVLAEVETRALQDGHEVVRLEPAERVVPGDQVIYTLEIRNIGSTAVREPTVIKPVPAHMAYVADSAAGPGAEVSYSVDGGRSFDRPENLRVMGEEGRQRLAKDKDYTHIRWILRNSLKSNSVAFARFRAVVR